MHCVAQAVYAEAKSESALGQRAVAHVIINRTKQSKFPKTLCEVVKQPGQFVYKTGHGPTWYKIIQIVINPGPDPTGGALYFKARYSTAKWSRRFVAIIGNHLFYK
jgi:spore germination cell wall hydrolase CwlJ-like protein